MASDSEPVFGTTPPPAGGDGSPRADAPDMSPVAASPVDLSAALRTVGGDVPLLEEMVADDDPVSCGLLEATLARGGHEVVVARDGREAWRALGAADRPRLAVLDWMMPYLAGIEVCRRARAARFAIRPYLILLTSRDRTEDVVAGLEAGADDYIAKPFEADELSARVHVGARMVELQEALADRVQALEAALARVRQLQGLLPICGWCKRIRSDQSYWQQIEQYITEHSEAQFSHGVCPDCRARVQKELDGLGPRRPRSP